MRVSNEMAQSLACYMLVHIGALTISYATYGLVNFFSIVRCNTIQGTK